MDGDEHLNEDHANEGEHVSKNSLKKKLKAEKAQAALAEKKAKQEAAKAAQPAKKQTEEDEDDLDPTKYYENRVHALHQWDTNAQVCFLYPCLQ